MKASIIPLLFAAVALIAAAQTNPPAAPAAPHADVAPLAAPPTGPSFDGGADARFRYDVKDNSPAPGGKVNTAYLDYFRLRTRLWGSVRQGRATLYGRLANEFRNYNNAPQQYQFPDELFVDALYLDLKGLFGEMLDLRVGRQDLTYGAGRLISDGGAGDGSRAAYFDAVRARLHLGGETTLDLFGVYQTSENKLVVGDEDYDMTSLTGGEDNDLTESAVGAYLTLGANADFPVELYSIWKDESDYYVKGDREVPKVPGRDFLTLGTRLTPNLGDWLSLELEGVAQTGETDDGRDILAFLGYAATTLTLAPEHAWKPTAKAALLYLSGDENAAEGDVTHWNPVFNRATWFSELGSSQYTKLYWTNLIYPHAELAIAPATGHRLSLEAGPMFAAKADTAQDDDYRGLLAIAKYQFPLAKDYLRKGTAAKGSVQAEVFEAGDYYENPETGYYLRIELNATL